MTASLFQQALVVGRFEPFHDGHKLLIDIAASIADEVHVVLAHLPGQEPSGFERASAMREHYRYVTHVRIHSLQDDGSNDPAVWAKNCSDLIGPQFQPDVVVSAEDYGYPLARALGASNVIVDPDRVKVPTSGTKIRRSPLKQWQYLPKETRAYYANLVPRICVLGPESTGTTTLAKDLSAVFSAAYVEEYGRRYHEERGPDHVWSTQDFVNIAKRQNVLEDEGALESNLVICDTDSFATAIWHERYMGFRSPEVEAFSEDRDYLLYILTGLDVPFEQDGFREEGPHREAMYARFKEELTAQYKPFIEVSGSPADRLRKAVEAVFERMPYGY